MPHALTLRFDNTRTARLVEPARLADLPSAVEALDLSPPRPVLALVGGADGLDPGVARVLEGLLRDVLAPLVEVLGAAVIDGGTDAGIMALMGRARGTTGTSFPLLGIAPRAKVVLPGEAPNPEQATLEPNHDRFLLVPGEGLGRRITWIAAAARLLAGARGRATLVAGGGRVTGLDVEASVAAGSPTLLLAGSGGTADRLASALSAESAETPPGKRPRLHCVALDDAGRALPDLLRGLLLG